MKQGIFGMALCVPLLAAAVHVQGADKNLLDAAMAEGNLTTFV